MSDDLPPPSFPPLISGHRLAASCAAFAVALEEAGAGRAGAGDLYWSEAVNRLDFALVFEPEVAARRAVQVHLAVMVACGDALGATAPPETAVHYRWPGTVLVNGAVAGEVRTGLARTRHEAAVPARMVTGLTLAIQPAIAASEPGLAPETTSLWEEGCAGLDRTRLIDSITRHILAWIDAWENEGFASVHEVWCGRAEGGAGNVTVAGAATPKGGFLGLDEDGNLLVDDGGGVRALDLLDHIERF